jgi:hypothetical protein
LIGATPAGLHLLPLRAFYRHAEWFAMRATRTSSPAQMRQALIDNMLNIILIF